MQIVDRGNECFGSFATNAGDRHDTLNVWVLLGVGFELLLNGVHLPRQIIKLCEFKIQFALPELQVAALLKRLSEGVDPLSAEAPCTLAGIDLDALSDEQSADRVLDAVDPPVQLLAVFDEHALLANFR